MSIAPRLVAAVICAVALLSACRSGEAQRNSDTPQTTRRAAVDSRGGELRVELLLNGTAQDHGCRGGARLDIRWTGVLRTDDPATSLVRAYEAKPAPPIRDVVQLDTLIRCFDAEGELLSEHRLTPSGNGPLEISLVIPLPNRDQPGLVPVLNLSGEAGTCSHVVPRTGQSVMPFDAVVALGLMDAEGSQLQSDPPFRFGDAPFASPIARTFGVTGELPGPCGRSYQMRGTLRVTSVGR